MGAKPSKAEIAEAAAQVFDRLTKARLTSDGGVDVRLRSSRKSDGTNGWFELRLSDEAHVEITHDAAKFIEDCKGRRLVAYLDDCAEDDTISYVTTSEFPDFANEFEDARSTDAERFGASTEVARLTVRAATFTRKSRPDIALLAAAQTGILGKTKHTFQFGPADEIRPIKGSIVQIGRDYSFAMTENFYFITDEKKFENLTGFAELIHTRASAAISELIAVSQIEFGDQQALQDASLHKEFARKLAAAKSLGVFEKMSRESILNDIEQNGVPIRYESKRGKLILHPDLQNRSGRRDLIDLLTENFFTSSSGQAYRALKKDRR